MPALWLLYAIPNGGHRHKAVAGQLKAQGVQAGVPDLCLPVARQGYHGLYIELKRTRGGAVSPAQRDWLEALTQGGYCAVVARGWIDAARIVAAYLEVPRPFTVALMPLTHEENRCPSPILPQACGTGNAAPSPG